MLVDLIDLSDGTKSKVYVTKGGIFHLDPLTPHQVTCTEDDTVILEASSKDSPEDNYRILPGDSQVHEYATRKTQGE